MHPLPPNITPGGRRSVDQVQARVNELALRKFAEARGGVQVVKPGFITGKNRQFSVPIANCGWIKSNSSRADGVAPAASIDGSGVNQKGFIVFPDGVQCSTLIGQAGQISGAAAITIAALASWGGSAVGLVGIGGTVRGITDLAGLLPTTITYANYTSMSFTASYGIPSLTAYGSASGAMKNNSAVFSVDVNGTGQAGAPLIWSGSAARILGLLIEVQTVVGVSYPAGNIGGPPGWDDGESCWFCWVP